MEICHSSGDWKYETKVLEESVSGESLLSGSETAIFLLCPQMAGITKELSGASYYKNISPICELITSQRPHTSKYHHIDD